MITVVCHGKAIRLDAGFAAEVLIEEPGIALRAAARGELLAATPDLSRPIARPMVFTLASNVLVKVTRDGTKENGA